MPQWKYTHPPNQSNKKKRVGQCPVYATWINQMLYIFYTRWQRKCGHHSRTQTPSAHDFKCTIPIKVSRRCTYLDNLRATKAGSIVQGRRPQPAIYIRPTITQKLHLKDGGHFSSHSTIFIPLQFTRIILCSTLSQYSYSKTDGGHFPQHSTICIPLQFTKTLSDPPFLSIVYLQQNWSLQTIITTVQLQWNCPPPSPSALLFFIQKYIAKGEKPIRFSSLHHQCSILKAQGGRLQSLLPYGT